MRRWPELLLASALLFGCSAESSVRRTLRTVGAPEFRAQVLQACDEAFRTRLPSQTIPEARWPAAARAFQPIGLWAEPDGAYLLIYSDADGERGLYVPRILSDKDPLCSPILKHVKFAEGVYWYERKRG